MLRSTMFKEELEDLKNRYMTRLVLHHVFSDEPTDAPLNMGLMNRDKIAEFLAQRAAGRRDRPGLRLRPVPDERRGRGRAAGRRRARGAHPHRALRRAPRRPASRWARCVHEAKPGDAEQARIVIIRDGMRREIEFRKDQPSILDAASAAGLEVPFSCTSRACAAPAAPS